MKSKKELSLNLSTDFKRSVGKLLNDTISNYDIVSKHGDVHLKAFKDIFKSNLYILLNNHFKTRGKPKGDKK